MTHGVSFGIWASFAALASAFRRATWRMRNIDFLSSLTVTFKART